MPPAMMNGTPAAAAQFQAGDVVDVKNHGRATVLAPVVYDAFSPHFGRCLVEYHEDGTQFHCNPKKLRKLKLSSSRVVVCYRTEHYRAAAIHNVERSDVCLEVGCHAGTTTRILHNRSKFVVGIDNVAVVVEVAKAKSPHVRFEVADGFDVEHLRTLSPTGHFDKILVDISGKAPLLLIARLLRLYLDAFPQSKIIVKNEALYEYVEQAQQAQHASQQQQRQRQREQHEGKEQHTGQNQQQQQEPLPLAPQEREGLRRQARIARRMQRRLEAEAQAAAAGSAATGSGLEAEPEGGPEAELGRGPGAAAGQAEIDTIAASAACEALPEQEQGGQPAAEQSNQPAAEPGSSGWRECVEGLEQFCELFREDYISHYLKKKPAPAQQGKLGPAKVEGEAEPLQGPC